MYESPPIPLLALRTVTYCTENEWTPERVVAGIHIEAQFAARRGNTFRSATDLDGGHRLLPWPIAYTGMVRRVQGWRPPTLNPVSDAGWQEDKAM